jgi:hypothetical protein
LFITSFKMLIFFNLNRVLNFCIFILLKNSTHYTHSMCHRLRNEPTIIYDILWYSYYEIVIINCHAARYMIIFLSKFLWNFLTYSKEKTYDCVCPLNIWKIGVIGPNMIKTRFTTAQHYIWCIHEWWRENGWLVTIFVVWFFRVPLVAVQFTTVFLYNQWVSNLMKFRPQILIYKLI